MLAAVDFRKQAREALKNKWALAISTGLVAVLLGGSSGGSIDFTRKENEGVLSNFDITELTLNNLQMIFDQNPSIMVGIVWGLVMLVVGGVTSIGYARFNLHLVDGRETSFSQLFSEYHRLGRGITMYLLLGMYILLWALLLIIPGIIASYSYAMTTYIMAERSDLSANEAITLSKNMMQGNKGRLFYLHLTFVGWILLSVITFGVGYLFLNPYMTAAETAFYKEISEQNRETTNVKTNTTEEDPFDNMNNW